MLGYRGVGGEIDGVRNPTLWARTGETVRITIVNGELMVHDIALEKLDVKSPQILDKGATPTSRSRRRERHLLLLGAGPSRGRHGRPARGLGRAARPPEGVSPAVNGRPLNLDFETGTLEDWTATGDAFDVVKDDGMPGAARQDQRRRGQSVVLGQQRRAGQRAQGHALLGPVRVTQPYASFLVSGGAFASTRVELVLADDDKVDLHDHGRRPGTRCGRRWSISGRTPAKRCSSGSSTTRPGARPRPTSGRIPWAHINFDHFRFHDDEAVLPERDHAAEISAAAADGSGDARRPLGAKRRRR